MGYDLYVGNKLNINLFKKEQWLTYLVFTNNESVNIERVDRLADIDNREAYRYTIKTLKIFESNRIDNAKINYYIETALKWSEVAKGGSDGIRDKWVAKGYNLDIHNIGSAKIYLEHSNDTVEDREIIYTLILTHGLIGQYIRGEVNLRENRRLYELVKEGKISEEDLTICLKVLNKCIISAVSEKLYDKLKLEIDDTIDGIVQGCLDGKSIDDRIGRLKKNCTIDRFIRLELDMIFNICDFWYVEPAVMSLKDESFLKILVAIQNHKGITSVKHINFKNMLNNLFYDYEDKKKCNIYKNRIIEDLLDRFTYNDIKQGTDVRTQHAWLDIQILGDTLYVDFKFTKVSLKLIEFCVEAERSGLAEYQQGIIVLYDMFGLRKDKLDRLGNEDKYLNNMNNSEQDSTKKDILKHIVGKRILDVGTGGGIMLDRLADRFGTTKQVYGCDISENVLEALNKRKIAEGKTWGVFNHNMLDKPTDYKFDTIIFSSILHEIYSYTETKKGRYNKESVKIALVNSFKSLNKGGRIIVRDGIRASEDKRVLIRFKDFDAILWFKQFIKDFKAYENMNNFISRIDEDTWEVSMDYAREVIFHMSWTLANRDTSKVFNDNYQYEKEEAFGYYTIDEYKNTIEEIGGTVIKADSYLESGYYEHTMERIQLKDLDRNIIDYPDSTCFIVIEK